MINLFLTTYYSIDYIFFIDKIFFIKARNSEWAYATGINTSRPFCIKLELKLNRKKKLNPCFTLQAKFISNFD